MSADLFAEFNSSSASTPPPPAQSSHAFGQQFRQQQQQQPTEGQGQIQDPFGFSVENNAAPAPQPVTPWSSFHNTANTIGVWAAQPAQVSQSPSVVPQPAEDDDGWGDFEVAQPREATISPKVHKQPPAPTSNGWDSYPAFSPTSTQMTDNASQAPITNSMEGGLVHLGVLGDHSDQKSRPSWSQTELTRRFQMKATPSDPNVLFDADDFELQNGGDEEDDLDQFGDFETVEPRPTSKPTPARASQLTSTLDLLALDDAPTTSAVKKLESRPAAAPLSFGAMASNRSQPSPSSLSQSQRFSTLPDVEKSKSNIPSTSKANTRSTPKASTKINTAANKVSSAKATTDDDEWGAWDDFSGAKEGNGGSQESDKARNMSWDAVDDEEPVTNKMDDNSPPPINVPPPSVLLSTFPALFSAGNTLFKPVAGQSTSIKQQVLSSPKTVRFLQGYVVLAATAARVIAGRKHRWHRDKILMKSMSISAAGSKGMKLAGVDKQQSAREDREAAEVVAAWREHVGSLRSAVAAANSTGESNLKVPELTEHPQIQTAKMVPTAPKPCVICGLKRDERVVKVDLDVEDSFGEWWVDHWGHRACKNFWVEHEQQLRQR